MTIRHKAFYVLWSLVTAVAMTSDRLRQEYSDYTHRCWENRATAMDKNEWLHRRWFPHKYDYEHQD